MKSGKESVPWVIVLLAAWLVAGCGGKDERLGAADDADNRGKPTGEPRADAGQSGVPNEEDLDPSDAGPQPDEPQCVAPTFTDDSPSQAFSRLEAIVVDQTGNPVPGVKAQACGTDLCLFGSTDDMGYVRHDGPQDIKKLAFKYGDGIRFAQFALPLPAEETHELGEQRTALHPDYRDGPKFDTGETLNSGGVELTLADNTMVEFDPFDVSAEERRFTAVQIEHGGFPDALPESLNAELLFSLGPLHTEFCPPAQLSVPNTEEWADGTEVEFLIHGTHVNGRWAPYAGWNAVSDGVVEDSRIVTLPEQGLPMTGAVAIRRK